MILQKEVKKMMDRETIIKGLEIERECVSRDCDRECCKCDLVQGGDYLLSVYDGAIDLLKGQEIGHWVVLEKCSNAGVYCSECHRKIFDHYPMRKQLSYFCPHCGTRMEGKTVRLDD